MLSPEIEIRICELLAAGWQYRRISRYLGVNRVVVGNIAKGQRPATLSRDAQAGRSSKYRRTAEIVPVYECLGCHKQVIYRPCQVCRVLAAIQGRWIERRADPSDDPDAALRLAPEVAEAAEKIRQEGFVNTRGTEFPPWSEAETERRAGKCLETGLDFQWVHR